ncbi:MAG: TraV family lipoprotein [Lamprobacter sp.]|uniref:TraV family lipoprotein n=1 Tax=Lamprobacter sp. TaxID=3100796 RepID=UPI002B25A98F|nr:TraV family lipoprotein [Lamprobacter sp.]MEA3642593.1 TraV family lipoprotein [Lamprobacter sp.]
MSSFAVLSGSALVLLLSGCSGSLPKALPEAVPSTRPDTLTALQAPQSMLPEQSQSGASASRMPRQASLAQSPANPKASPTSAASEATPRAPAPIRAPASVMRVWVAPWEDADGTLHGANHLFIEVLPRRWQLEGAVLPAAGVLQPLQLVERRPPEQRP